MVPITPLALPSQSLHIPGTNVHFPLCPKQASASNSPLPSSQWLVLELPYLNSSLALWTNPSPLFHIFRHPQLHPVCLHVLQFLSWFNNIIRNAPTTHQPLFNKLSTTNQQCHIYHIQFLPVASITCLNYLKYLEYSNASIFWSLKENDWEMNFQW